MKAILAVDVGTSSTKALLVGANGDVLAEGNSAYPTYSPQATWLEQNPEDWLTSFLEASQMCLKQIQVSVEAIGISGHMSAVAPLDKDFIPLRPAITIADTRCVDEVKVLEKHFSKEIAESTGNKPLTAFSLPKILWLKNHEPELFAKTRVFLGVKDYLRLRLTGSLGTEPTDAGNILLLDYKTRQWRDDLLTALELEDKLPDVQETLSFAGYLNDDVASRLELRKGIPVIAGLADMGSSTLGCGLVDSRRVAITLGTSGQITQVVDGPHSDLLGQFTYHPHALSGKTYVMASLFTGGLGLQWLAEVLSSFTGQTLEMSFEQLLSKAIESPPGAKGLLFLPFLVGRGSPDFNPELRASLLGLSREHTGADVARAVLEGVAFSVKHCLSVMSQCHQKPQEIVIGGGGLRSKVWQQIMADVVEQDLYPLAEVNAGPMGTAWAVAKIIGWPVWSSKLDLPLKPDPANIEVYNKMYQQYLLQSHSSH